MCAYMCFVAHVLKRPYINRYTRKWISLAPQLSHSLSLSHSHSSFQIPYTHFHLSHTHIRSYTSRTNTRTTPNTHTFARAITITCKHTHSITLSTCVMFTQWTFLADKYIWEWQAHSHRTRLWQYTTKHWFMFHLRSNKKFSLSKNRVSQN